VDSQPETPAEAIEVEVPIRIIPTTPEGLRGGEDLPEPKDEAERARIGGTRMRRNDDMRCDRCGRFFPLGALVVDKADLTSFCAACAAALRALQAEPIISDTAPALRLTELYAVAAVDTNGDEGLMGMIIGDGVLNVPLVVPSPDKVSGLIAWAQARAMAEGFRFRVYRCTVVEDVTDKAVRGALTQPAKP
jgi:hypothetical protein